MDWIRKLLQGVGASASNEELGRRSSVYPEDGQSRKSVVADNVDRDILLETSEKLREFRMLVGITTHPSFKAPRGFNPKQRPVVTVKGRPAPNLGLYPTVVSNEFKSKRFFKRFSLLINCCLGLQIIVAAALTALGASNGSHNVVTVFGAVNTVIAGFLTFLKGSGLPNRLKYYHQQWAKIREYIEHRERDLGTIHQDHGIDIHREVNIIRAMVEEVKADIEASTPDRFVGAGGLGAAKLMSHGTAQTSAILQGGANEASGKLGGLISGLRDARSKVEGLVGDIDGSTTASEVNRAKSRLADDVSHLKSKLRERMKEVEELEKSMETDVDTQAKRFVVISEKEAKNFVEDRAKEVGDMEKDIEAAGSDARDYVTDTFKVDKR